MRSQVLFRVSSTILVLVSPELLDPYISKRGREVPVKMHQTVSELISTTPDILTTVNLDKVTSTLQTIIAGVLRKIGNVRSHDHERQ
jgi:hypothetical protein